MTRKLLLPFVLLTLLLTNCAQNTTPTDQEIEVEFNERQLDKYVSQYADQLDLSRRQQRRIAKLEKRYDKREEKIGTLKFGQKRNLQTEKAKDLLDILSYDQIEKLNLLAGKRGLFKKFTE